LRDLEPSDAGKSKEGGAALRRVDPGTVNACCELTGRALYFPWHQSLPSAARYQELYGGPTDEPPYAPILGYNGGRSIIKGRLRSAISPLIDFRTKLEIVRDNLEERAAAHIRS
jgi:hypothetical protein